MNALSLNSKTDGNTSSLLSLLIGDNVTGRYGSVGFTSKLHTTKTGDNVTERYDSGELTSNLYTTKVVVQSVILFLAIFGNTCLMIVMCNRRRRNFSRIHMYIAHLCIADLFVAFFNILPQLVWDILGDWLAGDFLCRSVKFLQVFVMYLSTYILVLTALDRRRAICSPLNSHTWTFRLVHISVGFAYFLAAILSLPQAIIFKYQETSPGSGNMNCWVNFHPEWTLEVYITAFTILVYVIPLAILVYAYGAIYLTLFKRHKDSKHMVEQDRKQELNTNKTMIHNQTMTPVYKNGIYVRPLEIENIDRESQKQYRRHVKTSLVPRSNSLAGLSRAKMRTVKVTLVIILAYIGCWSPFFISQLWWLYDKYIPENNDCVVIMLLLASLNSCVNPWIYMVFSGTISSRACMNTMLKCTGRKQANRERSSGTLPSKSASVNTPLTALSVNTSPGSPKIVRDNVNGPNK